MSRKKTRNRTSGELFGERLREIQDARGLKNEEAARGIGVGLRLYQMWRADQLPGMKNLVRVARFYGVSVGWLLGDENGEAAA